MLKKIIAAALGLFVAAAFAASIDVNKATQAELEGLKGVGPGIATKIMDERKKSQFKDWNDLVDRVKGIGDANAAKLSIEGLTVNGSAYKPVAAAPAGKTAAQTKKEEAQAKKDAAKAAKEEAKAKKDAMKTAAKADAKPVATTPATPASAATPATPAKKAADAKADTTMAAASKPAAAKPAAAKASEPVTK